MSQPKRVKRQLDNTPQKPLPFSAASIIGLYLNPYELLKVAQVSRSWYNGFTSDAAWALQDVNGVKQGVYQNYLESKDMCEEEEWTCDTDKIKGTYNLHAALAVIRDGGVVPPTNLDDAPKSFFVALGRSLMTECYMGFNCVPEVYQSDKDLVYALLRVGFATNMLSPSYSHDRTAALCSQVYLSFEFGNPVHTPYSVDLLDDFEVALHAVTINYTVYSRLSEDKKANKQLFEAYLASKQ